MDRAIVGFHCDEDGDWVAHLECGHRQHVRHRPPFQMRPWVETAAGRAGRIGALLECPLCDRGEPPADPLPVDAEGGEAACYAHLVCPECGALVDRPGAHRPGCPAAGTVQPG